MVSTPLSVRLLDFVELLSKIFYVANNRFDRTIKSLLQPNLPVPPEAPPPASTKATAPTKTPVATSTVLRETSVSSSTVEHIPSTSAAASAVETTSMPNPLATARIQFPSWWATI
jgi:hypothetical protein